MSSRWDAAPAVSSAMSGSGTGSSPQAAASNDPAAAAAAAAARIAASYGVGSSTATSSQALTTLKSPNGTVPTDKRREGNEAAFNEFVDINDVKNRYLITRGPTQHQIHQDTGASLTTKGTWYPDRNLAKPDNPPLYIHIEAQTEEMLQKALARVNEVINSEAPQLIEERGMRGRAPLPAADAGYRSTGERRKWTEERINLGLESLRNFNVRAKIVGPGGSFVKYIQAETGTRVQIKGRGSGFIETDIGRESEEEMHVHITGPDDNQIAEAKTLALDLIDAVKTEWEKSRQVLEQQGFAVPGSDGRWPRPPAGTPAGPTMGPGVSGGMNGGYGSPYGQGQGQGQGQQPLHGSAGGYGGASAPAYGGQGYAAQQPYGAASPSGPAATAQPVIAQKSPEEEALDKYWKDYITWEDSFKAYHGRVPTKEDGGQDVPAKYRQGR